MRMHGAAAALALASVSLFSGVSSGQVVTFTEYAACSAVYTSGSQTVTVTQSTATVGPTPLSDASANSGTPFVLAVNTGTSSRKRQSTTAWIAENGNMTTNGTEAAVFTITNGSLSLRAGVVSTSEGVNFKVFAAAPGNISLTFSISNGALRWVNPAFDGGAATFYKTPADLIEGAEVLARFAGAIESSWAAVLLTAESESSALAVSPANATQSTSVATDMVVGSTSLTTGASGSASSGIVGVTTTNSDGATVVTSLASTSSSSTSRSLGVVLSMPPSSYGTSVVALNASTTSSSSSALPTISTPGQPLGPSQISVVANVSSSATPAVSTSGSVTFTFTPTPSTSSSASLSPSLSVSESLTYTLSASSTTGVASTNSSAVSSTGSTIASSLTSASASGRPTSTSTRLSSTGSSPPASGTSSLGSSSSPTLSSSSAPTTTSLTSTPATPSSTSPTTPAPTPSTTTLTATSTSTTTTSVLVTSTRTPSTTSTPYLTLPTPTACAFGDPPTTDQDDSFCAIPLPFTLTLYAQSDTTLYASTNGYLSILNGSQQYQVTTLPDAHIPANTLAPLFEDLYLYANATPAQGIFYQFDPSGVNGTVEYYLGSAAGGWNGTVYHFTVAYDTRSAGRFVVRYLSVPDGGANAAVGVQGVASSGQEVAYTYSYRQANIVANLTLTCDTTSGSGSCVAS
ncbi:hypothetical protein Tdes44962_MAKER00833 [Teratosphaeria destructans]|uniref:DUF7908 domain-containing protein n=1 Tax=Teratosphaeria destructans TaxID=418781 RepID=A0A9W7VZ69_9PEZI|nr:hypothetical protein Tdes44962_MAKER00833 [Teratosphaeria destructans]